jgi:hypothetical protein
VSKEAAEEKYRKEPKAPSGFPGGVSVPGTYRRKKEFSEAALVYCVFPEELLRFLS